MSSWGHKVTFSVYVEGHAPDIDDIGKAVQDLDARLGTDFVGVSVDIVAEEPHDQVAT